MAEKLDTDELQIKSLNADQPTYVIFTNRSGRVASLLWYNYQGAFVKYAELSNTDYMEMNTYVTHPWCARDSVTGDFLLVGGRSVYYPEFHEDYETIYIDLPVYSLKAICEQAVRKIYPESSIDNLIGEVPKTVFSDLQSGGKHEPHTLYKRCYVSANIGAEQEESITDESGESENETNSLHSDPD